VAHGTHKKPLDFGDNSSDHITSGMFDL